MRYTWIFALLLYIEPGRGIPSNRTVDDQKGDSATGVVPTYTPVDKWNIGQTCTACSFHPGIIDPSQALDGTWHDTSRYGASDTNRTVQIDFTGTAVYMYNILTNGVSDNTKLTELLFYLDGEQVGSFTHESDGTGQVSYNALVYKNTSLPNTPHSLLAVMYGDDTTVSLFDYAMYTVDEDDPTTSQSSSSTSSLLPSSSAPPSPEATPPPKTVQQNQAGLPRTETATIAGGVVGGILALTAALLSLFFYYRVWRRRRARGVQPPTQEQHRGADPELAPTPYPIEELGRSPSRDSVGSVGAKVEARWSRPSMIASEALAHSRGYSAVPEPITPSPQRQRFSQLSRRIQALQAQIDEPRAALSDTTSVVERNLLATLGALRGEMAALRADLGQHSQQYGTGPAPPSYRG